MLLHLILSPWPGDTCRFHSGRRIGDGENGIGTEKHYEIEDIEATHCCGIGGKQRDMPFWLQCSHFVSG